MAVVVDACLISVIALQDPRAPAVARQLTAWLHAAEPIHAPHLLPYEVTSALTRSVAAGRFHPADLPEAWQRAAELPIQLEPVHDGTAIVRIARRLQRHSAYDAAYIALAEQLGAQLWTLDGPLSRNAASIRYSVHLVT